MTEDPFPQTLPQQLRQMGERWEIGRLRVLYTMPIGRFLLYWMAVVILLRLGIRYDVFAMISGIRFDSTPGYQVRILMQLSETWAEYVGAISLVVWFQCRWPEPRRWGVFMVMALAYALFLSASTMVLHRHRLAFDIALLWPVAVSLLRVAVLLFLVRTGNLIVRLFLVDAVDRQNQSASQLELPTSQSWSLRGIFLTVFLAAIFLAAARFFNGAFLPGASFDIPSSLPFYWWSDWFLHVLIVLLITYVVAVNRIRNRRWIWWLALVLAVALPQWMGWLYWRFTMPVGPLQIPRLFSALWIELLVVTVTMGSLKCFFVACERSGYQLAMWIRGSENAIPSA